MGIVSSATFDVAFASTPRRAVGCHRAADARQASPLSCGRVLVAEIAHT